MLDDIYNDLHFFDKATVYDSEKQANDIQDKIRKYKKELRID